MKENCAAPKINKASATLQTWQLVLSADSPVGSWILDSVRLFTLLVINLWKIMLLDIMRKVYLANGEPLDIVGIEDVKRGCVKNTKMKHVPKLMRNFISVGRLDDQGNVTFHGGAWKIIKCSVVVARGKKIRNLYMTSDCRDMIVVAETCAKLDLWHCILIHMSEKKMMMFVSNGKIPN